MACVSAATSADLPVLGGPTSATCPAPSRGMMWLKVLLPALPPAASGSFAMRALRSAWRPSVPLCLGTTRSISSSASSFSSGLFAARNRSSARLYSGVRLAGIAVVRRRGAPAAATAGVRLRGARRDHRRSVYFFTGVSTFLTFAGASGSLVPNGPCFSSQSAGIDRFGPVVRDPPSW